jgi:uncharacterized protein YeaO (DUF488 family)
VGEEKMIRTKSVYSPIERQRDGLRIFATRIRGRGLKKSRYHAWMANLGPSEKLLRSSNISWPDFGRRYRCGLLGSSAAFDTAKKGIKNHGQKFTLRLIQQLGSAPGPTASDRRRLWAVKKVYHAKSVVQYQWQKGKSSEFFTLGQNLKWKLTTSRELFQ